MAVSNIAKQRFLVLWILLWRAVASGLRHSISSHADLISRLVKVHMRRRHGAPAAEPKAGSPTEG
jgi:hypothetical protein